MRYTLLIVTAGLLFAGCAQDARYTDQEFGVATQDAFDRQIVYKDYRYADRKVEGLDGIHAESIMETYHNTFTESFTSESFDIGAAGTVSGN